MKSIEAIAKIKALLKFSDEKKFENAKLSDGTLLQWEGELTEGTALMAVAEDGNMMPVEDATHTLEDGTQITTVGGLVTAIEQKKEEVKEEIDASEFEKMFVTHLETFNNLVDRLTALESKVSEYETKFSEISKVVEDSATEVKEKFEKVVELVSAISEEPAPVAPPTNITFKKTPKKGSALELFKQFQAETKK